MHDPRFELLPQDPATIGTMYDVRYYINQDSNMVRPVQDPIPAHTHYASDLAMILEADDGTHWTWSVVAGSQCLNPLGHVPDAVNFDDFAVESMEMISDTWKVVGWARFDVTTNTYVPDIALGD